MTHSICTLEFEDHRPLYDWLIDNLPVPSRPRQYEFARLNIDLHGAVEARADRARAGGHVSGWDDPRMPTLAGLRRRGVPPEAIREFVRRIGVAKANSVVDVGMFEFAVREVLNRTAPRRMAVLRPLKAGDRELSRRAAARSSMRSTIPTIPPPARGKIRFGRELYIERDDFMENPPKKFYRLVPGREVRLRYAYFVTCREVGEERRRRGRRTALHLRSGNARRQYAPDGRKVQATLHWVSAADAGRCRGAALQSAVRHAPIPSAGDFAADLNPNSLEVVIRCAPRAGAWRQQCEATRAVRAARAISAAIRTAQAGRPCSTARSDCAIPGPRYREGTARSCYLRQWLPNARMTPVQRPRLL